jgi:hypothetical protein
VGHLNNAKQSSSFLTQHTLLLRQLVTGAKEIITVFMGIIQGSLMLSKTVCVVCMVITVFKWLKTEVVRSFSLHTLQQNY